MTKPAYPSANAEADARMEAEHLAWKERALRRAHMRPLGALPNIFDPLPVGAKTWPDRNPRGPREEKLKPGYTKVDGKLIYNPLDDPEAKRHWDKGAKAEAEKVEGFPCCVEPAGEPVEASEAEPKEVDLELDLAPFDDEARNGGYCLTDALDHITRAKIVYPEPAVTMSALAEYLKKHLLDLSPDDPNAKPLGAYLPDYYLYTPKGGCVPVYDEPAHPMTNVVYSAIDGAREQCQWGCCSKPYTNLFRP